MKISELVTNQSMGNLESFYIMEMYDAKFQKLSWYVESGAHVGIGEVEDLKVRVVIDPTSYDAYQGANLTFGVWDGKEFTEKYRNVGTLNASKIIGAVKNALVEKILEFDVKFVILVAKDNVEQRTRIYQQLAKIIAAEQKLEAPFKFDVRDCKVTLVSWLTHDITVELIDKLKSSL